MFIYAPAKHRRSGTTMQKVKSPSHVARYEAAREVMPGFPWPRRFTTRSELNRYLDDDRLTCLICGRRFKSIGKLHLRIHEISADDYKVRFGIPYKIGLLARRTREKFVEIGHANKHRLVDADRSKNRRRPARPSSWLVRTERTDKVRGKQRKKYTSFDWHLQTLATVWRYTKVRPPEGHASWSGFKKRWLRDKELRMQMLEARAKFRL